ncbi:MAG: hypothetical protein LDL42_03490 [Rhizobium sp.]|nr:hypothetical protein [Rhizobium sp.]
MDHVALKNTNHLLTSAVILAGAIVCALAFAGWMRFGADIVLTYADNGLSSCL